MPKLRLTEEDQKRLGVDGDLPIDLKGITNREAIALKALGFATPNVFRAALKEDDPTALTGMVWLCLKRAGIEADPQTLEFNITDADYIADPEPEPEWEESGKVPEREASTSSAS